MAEQIGTDDVVLICEPATMGDLAFIESMLESAGISYSTAGEKGKPVTRPQLYVARRDADDVRALLAELNNDSEIGESLDVPAFTPPAPLGQPSEYPGGFDPPSFGAHVLRVILFVVVVFAAIAALMFLLSRLS